MSSLPPPEKRRISPQLQGFLLLALAVALLWAAQHFDRTAQQAHHRLLVSTEKARGDVFEKSVILVMHHLKSGAVGIVLNKPQGGPVGPDKVFTLHTLDVTLPETSVLKDIQMGVVEGDDAAKKLQSHKPPPRWSRSVRGYAGWSGRQLEAEIDQGEWRIIPFDAALVRKQGQAMWNAADATASKK